MRLLVLLLTSGIVLAETSTIINSAPAKYTEEQKACVKTAQDKKNASIKSATDILNTATKDALKIKQEAIKTAQKNKDSKARTIAMQNAEKMFNSNDVVKQAKPAFMEAVKTANEQYQSDVKACLGTKGGGVGFFRGMFKGIGNGVSGAFSGMWKFFTGKK